MTLIFFFKALCTRGSGHLELNPTVHQTEFGIKGYFVCNIKSLKSVAWLWAAVINISVVVKDNGVILEALPGVSFFPHTAHTVF